jgi:hypothetical protein
MKEACNTTQRLAADMAKHLEMPPRQRLQQSLCSGRGVPSLGTFLAGVQFKCSGMSDIQQEGNTDTVPGRYARLKQSSGLQGIHVASQTGLENKEHCFPKGRRGVPPAVDE